MIPKIQRILYATDLSENSAYAFRYAVNSARKHDADLIILHVVEKLSENVKVLIRSYFDEKTIQGITEQRLGHAVDRIKKRLEIFTAKELKDDPEVANRVKAIEVCEGYPGDVILSKAAEFDCDIIMGTHGKGFIEQAVLGSNTRHVLRHGKRPVFVIPLPHEETDISFCDI